jgi:hypothetical protein
MNVSLINFSLLEIHNSNLDSTIISHDNITINFNDWILPGNGAALIINQTG